MSNIELSKAIYNSAIKCGFDNCGIISIDKALNGFRELYQKRISDVPQSKSFYNNIKSLRNTKERFPWAKAIVILSFELGRYSYPKELQGKYAKSFFLEPKQSDASGFDLTGFERWFAEHQIHAEGGEQFHAGSIGPLRFIAAKAGLGIIRKNNFFYTENGSYNFLIGYVIDEDCELIHDVNFVPCSDKCDLCRRACKTKALQAEYTMNPLKCVSFLTTFGNSGVPQDMSPDMFEEWICGCDNCQDACPHNRLHNWSIGKDFSNIHDITKAILPQNYKNLSDEFLIEQVIPKTAGHLQASDVDALRINAERSINYQKQKSKIEE